MESKNEYYIQHADKLLKEFGKMTRHTKKSLNRHYGEITDIIVEESRKEFQKLIPEIPYIGGNTNPNTGNIILTAMALALYRTMQSHGKTVEDTGKVILETIEYYIGSYPRIFLRLLHKLGFAPNSPNSKKMKKYEHTSQSRKWPNDWVYSYVEGDKESFDWGTDYTECGVIKFLEKKNAKELTKYLCACDFPLASAYGVQLIRTQTLADGASFCDFKFKE